jgi:hypothetical protein
VPDRILHNDFVQHGPVVQLDEEGIADAALRGVVIVDAESLVLNAVRLGAQCVDASV